ncbi:hypothetical protein [Alicyclobacillus shizuokensis]|uniref:hypothetical protein n=1 Tax=Alicyclobacillus shizuokensis TaxID=392014 RepID=UPI00082A8037|nr:hypothetical protein [Alicyclobacillus shizuokensis]
MSDYTVLVDGKQVGRAKNKAAGVKAIDIVVQKLHRKPGHTYRVELLDSEGQRLRVAYLPPGPEEVEGGDAHTP